MSKKELYIELCNRMHNGEDEATRLEARDALVEEILPFVGYVIREKYGSFIKDYDELFQEGALAIMEDIENYDPEKGALTTFFMPRIRNRISSTITERVNKTNRYYAKKMKIVKEALQYFEAKGLTPSTYDIHSRTGLSMKSVSDTLDFIKRVDMSYSAEEEPVVIIEQPHNVTPEGMLLEKERRGVLEDALSCLPVREREVIEYRFGFTTLKQNSITNTAKHFSIQEQEVTKLIRHGLNLLKENKELKSFYKGKVDKVEKERNRGRVDFLDASSSVDVFPEELDGDNVEYSDYMTA